MSDLQTLNKRLHGVAAMWAEWAVCVGALAFAVSLSFFIPYMIIPGVVLIIAWQLSAYYNTPLRRTFVRCVRVAPIVSRSLIYSAVVMVICLLYSHLTPAEANKLNPDIPFITSLILYPITALVSLFYYKRFTRRPCHYCKMAMGVSELNEVHSRMFYTNARGQMVLLCWLSAVTSVVDWAYYFFYYSNVSLSAADKYFFLAVPIIIYVLSLLYLKRQYNRLSDDLRSTAYKSSTEDSLHSVLRFIIIRNNAVLVTEHVEKKGGTNMFLDTPAIVKIPVSDDRVTDEGARTEFAKISGETDFILRPLYNTPKATGKAVIYHYAVIMNDDVPLPENWPFGNNWLTIQQLATAMRARVLSGDLSEEIYRVYTITMAWKTYDKRGFRRYPIKNYRPTFRLRDLKDWDVDYNDRHWLKVSGFNQDVPFFRIKRYFRNLLGKK